MATQARLTWLRADVAKCDEDWRIARKHTEQAAGRPWTAENRAAYIRCTAWETLCAQRALDARGRLIRAIMLEREPLPAETNC